jgi:hypothetical protein
MLPAQTTTLLFSGFIILANMDDEEKGEAAAAA